MESVFSKVGLGHLQALEMMEWGVREGGLDPKIKIIWGKKHSIAALLEADDALTGLRIVFYFASSCVSKFI